MSLSLKLILLLLLQSSYCFNEYDSLVIAIYDPKSDIDLHCINTSAYNYSIDNLPLFATDNTTIIICSNQLKLRQSIIISDVSDLLIVGYGHATIKCSKNNTRIGLSFIGVHNLELQDLTVEKCASKIFIKPTTDDLNNIKASVGIQSSTNIKLIRVNVINGQGSGLVLFHNDGIIQLINCSFQGNGQDRKSGGNGVYIETGTSSNGENSTTCCPVSEYTFNECRFTNNKAKTGKDNKIRGFSRFDKGGGVCIYIRGSKGIAIQINHSIFERNEVLHYGGGLLATFHGNATDSIISVTDSIFMNNKGMYGGAHYVGYLHSHVPTLQSPRNCSHIFKSNYFANNSASFGGSTSIFSTKTTQRDVNLRVSFENCTWKYNEGEYGSAIAILPNAWNIYTEGYLPTPIFKDCTIESNYIKNRIIDRKRHYSQYTKGAGALYCSGHVIMFNNRVNFVGNNGSAVYLGYCIVHINDYSLVNFTSNLGYHGGAIYQLSSIIYLHHHIIVLFDSNQAYDRGGAIYQVTFDMHIFNYSRTCFIDYINSEEDVEKRNISVQFFYNQAGIGNRASSASYGHSLYTSSLLPCYNRFRFSDRNLTFDIFNQIGKFTYRPRNRKMEITTEIYSYHYGASESSWFNIVPVIPGKEKVIPFRGSDDLKQNVHTDYLISIHNTGSTNIRTDHIHSHITNDTISLLGKVNDTGIVTLSASTTRNIALTFEVKIQPCPPGFIQQDSLGPCICSANTHSEYLGISRCNSHLSQAYKKRGFWIGYDINTSVNEDSLISSYCPPDFCRQEYLLLPATANRIDLDQIVCLNKRMGIVCGQCRDNYSVHYHSTDFKCKLNKYCKWGWLFFIISEMVPVTIIFVLIIVFNISFTSGRMNGFVFYAQVVIHLRITADNFIPYPYPVHILHRIHYFIYFFFSFTPFKLDEISFCIWQSASALDILSVSYITLAYSFCLICTLTLVLNKCSFTRYRFFRCCNRAINQKIGPRGSIVDGLSAFLILFYIRCIHACILILAPSHIYNKGYKYNRIVVFFNGEILWMSKSHLNYVIPSIIALILVSLPPLLLLIYPLHYKILSLVKLGESQCIRAIFHPIEKLKPFMDSFQSCFKDDFRFFSGLYFIYRLIILINMTLARFQEVYILLEIQLAAMLVIHATCQPYKARSHNIIDTLLLGNLAIINAFTMYNYSIVNSDILPGIFVATSWFQITLIFLPFVIALAYVLMKIICLKKVKKCWPKSVADHEENQFPARMLYGAIEK